MKILKIGTEIQYYSYIYLNSVLFFSWLNLEGQAGFGRSHLSCMPVFTPTYFIIRNDVISWALYHTREDILLKAGIVCFVSLVFPASSCFDSIRSRGLS